MQINLTFIGTGPVIEAQNILIHAAQTNSALAIVGTPILLNPPHDFPINVTYTVPNPVPHWVTIYTTPNTAPGQIVSRFMVDPSVKEVKIRMPLQLTIGGDGPYDPAEGTNVIGPIDGSAPGVISTIEGWEWIPHRRNMFGTMVDNEFTRTGPGSETGKGGTGFTLTGEDDAFYMPDYVWFYFQPQISTVQPVFQYIDLYTGVVTLTEDAELIGPLNVRKLNEIMNTAGNTPTITMPALETVPLNGMITFSTMRGTQKQAKFVAEAGELFLIGGGMSNVFMGEQEVLNFMRGEEGWHITQGFEGMKMAGSHWDGMVQAPNTIRFDGVTGYSRVQYPRLEWFAFNKLSGGMLYTKAARDAGGVALAQFWAYDALFIYPPDHRGLVKRSLVGDRGNDSGRDNTAISGSYEGSLQKEHYHFTVIDRTLVSGSGFIDFVSATFSMIKAWTKTDGGGRESYRLGKHTAQSAFPAEQPTLSPTNLEGDGPENTMVNVAVLTGCYI